MPVLRRKNAKEAESPEAAETTAPVKAAEKPKRIPKPPQVGKRVAGRDTLIIKTDMIDISHLQPYHKNPRVGNVDEIAKSLHANNQFKPIVVNVGTHTGRKYEILAGNHTYLAAKKSLDWQQDGRHMHKDPWTKLYAAFVDVSDDECKRIVLADNRTAEYGAYDDGLLAQLFAELPDTVGTGYHKEEMDKIIAGLPQPEDADAVFKSLEDFKAAMPAPITGPETDNRVGGKWEDGEDSEPGPITVTSYGDEEDDEEEDVDEEDISIDEVSIQLQTTLSLLEGRIPKGDNHWEIPDLREDMLLTVDDIKGLRTWADHELTPDDGKSTFFANYGSGARKGLPFDRSILGFYNEDDAFEKWFQEPSWHVTKFALAGLTKAIVPDFSLYGDAPRAVHVYNIFKAMWLGRFMQEAGWRVAPRLRFCATDPNTWETATLGIPEGPPVLFLGAQNFGRMENQAEETRLWKEAVVHGVQKVDPEVLVAYVGVPGKKVIESVDFGKWRGEIRYIDSVSTIRNRKRDANALRVNARKKKLKQAKEKAVSDLKKIAPEMQADDSAENGSDD